MVSPEWQEDEESDEAPVIPDDSEHPQWVDVFDTQEEAEALAASMNASHGNRPFLAYIAYEEGLGGDDHLVTAAALPTDKGRWAVLVVIETQAC